MNESGMSEGAKPRIVIVGGGFGGLEVARRLRRSEADVTLIDKHNYHLFQPLLYQVATGGLSPANIATPLRAILGRQKNCQVVLADVQDVDASNRELVLNHGRIPYDYLVIATGSCHSYFGNDQWQQHAPGLKSLHEATEIRRRIFTAFELAERETDPDSRKELMTFVIVGGGPTGVELAGALSEISRNTLKLEFRNIHPSEAKIILVEAAENILGAYPEQLSGFAEQKLGDLQVETRKNQKVTSISGHSVTLESTSEPENDRPHAPATETVACRTILWAAGVKGNGLGKALSDKFGFELAGGAYVPVTDRLQLPQDEHVYVIGDLAHVTDPDGNPLPKVAPVAIQQGRYIARRLNRLVTKCRPLPTVPDKPFQYRDLGSMATIGRAAAIAKIGKIELRGFVAWLLWLGVHLIQLVQFQNRLLVLIQWAWNYFTFNRSARIIIGSSTGPVPPDGTTSSPSPARYSQQDDGD